MLTIKINDVQVEQSSQEKYLGVILDSKLSGKPHVDFTCGKALRAMSKISGLMKGRHGINVKLGIQLYVTLVRPHLEYALPAWFFMAGGHINELERVQAQCLKKIMDLHAQSSSEALQVTSGVLPFRLRAEELCAREYMRILEKQLDHPL